MQLTRRNFLRTTAAGLATVALPLVPSRTARGATSRNVLVAVYLRGGADGLNLVIPYADAEYYSLRPTTAVPAGQYVPVTGLFGMHSSISELQALYASGDLAVVHCAGSTDQTRSHFDAQDYMERAAPGNKSVVDGWLNRYLAAVGQGSALAGVTLGWSREASLDGLAPNLSMPSLSSFDLGGSHVEERKAAIHSLHGANPGSLLTERTEETLAVVDAIAGVSTDTAVPYPQTSFARQLRDVAALIRADLGVQVAALSLGGWDNHDDQVVNMQRPMERLSQALSAFYQDLGGDAGKVLTLVMTEFGRTVEENGTFGADHGRGSLMFALGGGVTGGRVILKDDTWPGLTPNESGPRRDLDVTTDFRDVFAEVLDRHLGLGDQSAIFPNFAAQASNYPGLYV
jgi:uncharacterized protein (DUF1501 family)